MAMEPTDVNLYDVEDYDSEIPHDQLPSVEEVLTAVGGTKPKNSSSRKLLWIVSGLTVFVLLIVAIAVPVSKNSVNGDKEVRKNLSKAINMIAINGKKDFKDEKSYQSFAKRWLLEDPIVGNYTYDKLQQRYAMYCLYHETTGPDGWVQSKGWKRKGVPECEWFGVHCEEKTGMVTRISLRENGLRGEIPPEVSLIPKLEVFNVHANDLTGKVPQHLCDVQSERNLDVKVDCAEVACDCCASCSSRQP